MAAFQSLTRDSNHSNRQDGRVSVVTISFQSLTRDSNHSNKAEKCGLKLTRKFQSLTRDSNHSNKASFAEVLDARCFNPSRGIAIIQTYHAGARPGLS